MRGMEDRRHRRSAGHSPPTVVDTTVGPGLPTLRIGDGEQTLAYLPGLTVHPGHPTGRERRRALSGWEPLLDRYTVYRVGRRVRAGATFEDMAGDVLPALEALGPPVDLMGESTGGAIALHVAAARPDLVRRLVLVTTAHRLSEAARRLARRGSRAARAGDWRRGFATMMSIAAPWPAAGPILAGFGWLAGPRIVGIPSDPTQVLAELAAWQGHDAADLLSRITTPTLVIGTQRDQVFPESTVRELAARLPDASLVIVPRLAHWFPPHAIERHIAPFLGSSARVP